MEPQAFVSQEGDWGARGTQGVRLLARRMPDGSAAIGTFHDEQEGPMMFLHLSPPAVLSLIEYLVNRPEVTN